MTLQEMLDTQMLLQTEFDWRATSEDPQTSCEYIKDMCIALAAETMEMMEETGWKPWSNSWHVNREEARAEWIDCWHFLLNLANKLGMDEDMIRTLYQRKADINLNRIRNNYDGVTTKCKGCGRALDDPATTCGPRRQTDGDDGLWCSKQAAWV